MVVSGFMLCGKFVVMILVIIGVLVVLFVVFLINGKSQMFGDCQDKVCNLVEVVYMVIGYFEKEVCDGWMIVEDVKKVVIEVVKVMCYDKVEYFWINDLNDLMVMYLIKLELDGKKLDQIKDKNGKFLFQEFNKVVKL